MVVYHLEGNGLSNQGHPVFPVITLATAIPVCYAFICHGLNSASSVDFIESFLVRLALLNSFALSQTDVAGAMLSAA